MVASRRDYRRLLCLFRGCRVCRRGDEFGIKSSNGVSDHLNALERKGYIERHFNISRGIRVL